MSNQAVGLTLASTAMLSAANSSNKANNLSVKSPQQAIQIVKRHYKGKILRVQSSNNGAPGYRVKLVTQDGQVFTVKVNARTGAVSRN